MPDWNSILTWRRRMSFLDDIHDEYDVVVIGTGNVICISQLLVCACVFASLCNKGNKKRKPHIVSIKGTCLQIAFTLQCAIQYC